MKKLFLVIFLFSAVTAHMAAQTVSAPDNDNFVVTHGPYLQNLSATGVTIVWTTNKSALPGVIINGGSYKNQLVRNSNDGLIDAGGTLHRVRIEGLEPGTAYEYRISSIQILKYQAYKVYFGDTLVLKANSFRTFPLVRTDLRFTVVNDVHENSAKLGGYLRAGKGNESDFVIFNGDMVDFLQDYNQLFRGFTDTAVRYFATTKPFFYVRGNHETRGYLARGLKEYFDYPGGRFYYGITYGTTRLIVLDCGEDKPDNNRYYYGMADFDRYRRDEQEWLRNELKSDECRKAEKKIVLIHMPVLKQGSQNYAMQFLSENFGPLLKEAGVNLVISAHTHRTAYYDKDQSGYGYPLLVNSNNSFAEILVTSGGITATIRDIEGRAVIEKVIK